MQRPALDKRKRVLFWHISNPSLIVARLPLHQDLLLLPPSLHHLWIVLPDSYEWGIGQRLCSIQPQVLKATGGCDLIKALLKTDFAFHLKPLSSDWISGSRWTVHVTVMWALKVLPNLQLQKGICLLKCIQSCEVGCLAIQCIVSNIHIQYIFKIWFLFFYLNNNF